MSPYECTTAMTHTSDSFYAHKVDFNEAKVKLVIWAKWENVRYF